MAKAPKSASEAIPKSEETTTAAPAGNAALPLVDPDLAPALIEVPVLQVVGPAKGRWRIGQKFTPEVTVLVLADLTHGQMQALSDDPELVVIKTTALSAALVA